MMAGRFTTVFARSVIGAVVLAWIVGCSSTDRQWRDGQTMLENLPR